MKMKTNEINKKIKTTFDEENEKAENSSTLLF